MTPRALSTAGSILVVACACGNLLAEPQPSARGQFVQRILDYAGKPHRYAVWLPPGYTPSREWPGIFFLHGAGECGSDGIRPTRIGLGPALDATPERWPCVVVFPQKPREDEEWEEHEALVLSILDRARKEFHMEPRRIALVGVSQGGHGAWLIGARNPNLWSCLVPICGYGRAATVAPRVASLPVWAFHGERDDVVDPSETRKILAALHRLRASRGLDTGGARSTLFADANHNSWDPAFATAELPGWILSQVRPR